MSRPTKVKHESSRITTITTSTPYGSHKSMVIKDLGEIVICKDDLGEYETLKNRLDSGLADPKRFCRM